MEILAKNNTGNSRFEIQLEDGEFAFLDYRYHKKDIVLMHTVVPDNHQGQGLAGKLAVEALTFAKSNKIPVVVYCPFVAGYLKKHPEYFEQMEIKLNTDSSEQ